MYCMVWVIRGNQGAGKMWKNKKGTKRKGNSLEIQRRMENQLYIPRGYTSDLCFLRCLHVLGPNGTFRWPGFLLNVCHILYPNSMTFLKLPRAPFTYENCIKQICSEHEINRLACNHCSTLSSAKSISPHITLHVTHDR